MVVDLIAYSQGKRDLLRHCHVFKLFSDLMTLKTSLKVKQLMVTSKNDSLNMHGNFERYTKLSVTVHIISLKEIKIFISLYLDSLISNRFPRKTHR